MRCMIVKNDSAVTRKLAGTQIPAGESVNCGEYSPRFDAEIAILRRQGVIVRITEATPKTAVSAAVEEKKPDLKPQEAPKAEVKQEKAEAAKPESKEVKSDDKKSSEKQTATEKAKEEPKKSTDNKTQSTKAANKKDDKKSTNTENSAKGKA